MTDKKIRVGFIGLNPGIHWAATAHMPALKALPNDYEVVGVANTSLASAPRAADAFDATELAPLIPPPSAYSGWPTNAVAGNVARLYALVAKDIRAGTRTAPNFLDALALHETLDAIEHSATGSHPK